MNMKCELVSECTGNVELDKCCVATKSLEYGLGTILGDVVPGDVEVCKSDVRLEQLSNRSSTFVSDVFVF